MTVIQTYAPTEEYDEGTKELYYEQLQQISQKVPKHDLLVVMDDINAKMGNDNKDYENILGKNGIGVLNDNGQRLIDFFQLNDLVISGSLFQQKDVHKAMWTAPHGLIKNQIDHFCIRRKFRCSLLNAGAYQRADINSDHQSCSAKMEIRLKSTAKRNTPSIKKLDTERLKALEISNKFKKLRNNLSTARSESNIETEWANIKPAYIESATKLLGYRKQNHKQWIAEVTRNKIEKRKQIKSNVLNLKTCTEKEEPNGIYEAL